jgi:RHS repeat-associated protein
MRPIQTRRYSFVAMLIAWSSLVSAGGYVDWRNKTPLQQSQDTAPATGGVNGTQFTNSVFTDHQLIASINNDLIKTASTADPVSTVTGNNYHDETDLVIKGRGGLNFVFTRTYNSGPTTAQADGKPMGFGWTHSYNMRLRSNDFGQCPNCTPQQRSENGNGITSSITYVDERGGEVSYLVNDSTYAVTAPKGTYDTLQLADAAEGNAPSISFRNGVKYVFQSGVNLQLPNQTARLARIKDPYGNQLTFTYTGTNLTSISDGISIGSRTGAVTLAYNVDNRLASITDWAGRTWTYGYDTAGHLTSMTRTVSGASQVIAYTYHPGTHNLKDIILPETRIGPNGQPTQVKTTFAYYQNGKAFNYTNALGETETLDYDLFRRSTRVTDPRGFVREYFYDSYGQLTKLVEGDGSVLLFENNPDTTLRFRKYDALGYSTTYSYRTDKAFTGPTDTGGQVTREQDALGNTVDYTYGVFDQVTSVKDKKGTVRSLEYYINSGGGAVVGKLFRERISALTVGATTHTNVLLREYTYFPNGNLQTKTEHIDPANTSKKRVTTYAYDSAGLNLVQMKVSGSGTDVIADFGYDLLGRKTTDTIYRRLVAGGTPQALTSSYDYDERDRVVRVSDPVGNQLETVYDKNGKATQVIAKFKKPDTTFESRVISARIYDAADRLISQTDIQNNSRTFRYDQGANLVSYTDANNHTTRYEYDAMGRRTAVINANGHRTETTYDLAGRAIRTTNAVRKSTITEYDALGRAIKSTEPRGFSNTTDYDANGNVIRVTDRNARDGLQPVNATCGGTICRFYDQTGRLARQVDALDGETKYTYDLLGNILSITDAEGRVTGYTFDDLGRQVEVAHPAGGITAIAYNEGGDVLSRTDRKAQTIQYRYDELGRLIEVQYPSGAGQTLVDTFSFDSFGNRVGVGQYTAGSGSYPGIGLYSYTYDAKNRLTGRTDLRLNRSLGYTYDPVGNLLTKADYQGQITTYRYDQADRLVELSNPEYGQVGYQYDPAGRVLARILANGARTIYDHDDANRLRSLVHYGTNGNVVLTQAFVHDQVGNVIAKFEPAGVTNYRYDALYRLTQVSHPGTTGDESFTYDKVGNRLTTAAGGATQTYVVDIANRLKEVRASSPGGTLIAGFAYDANGNLIKKCSGGALSVTATDCSGSVVTSLSYDGRNRATAIGANTFKYDPFDYRIEKSNSGGIFQYLLEGEHVEAVYRTGQVEAKYLRGVIVDEIVMGFEKDAGNQLTAYNFHHDSLQSLNAKTGPDGSVLQTASYGAFGNLLDETNPNPNATYVRYTGRELDNTGFYYYRARYYDPAVGRFISEDPLGFRAGVNFYAYVGNNPINANDPTGQDAAPYHFIATFVAARREGMSMSESLALAWNVMTQDKITGPESTFNPAAGIQNRHGTGGMINDPVTGELRAQTPAERIEGITREMNAGPLEGKIHNAQDFQNTGHRDGTFEGIRTDAGLGTFLTSVVETAYHVVVHDWIAPLFGLGDRIVATQTVIQADRAGHGLQPNPDGSLMSIPSYDPGGASMWPGAAGGGFVIYPNKSNLNMLNVVYKK